MAKPTFSGEARDEFDAAHDYYLARSVPAAVGFDAAVDRALATLEAFPGIGTPVGAGHRRQPVPRYPFGLVYRLTDDGRVRVVGVPHDRQLPVDWSTRDRP